MTGLQNFAFSQVAIKIRRPLRSDSNDVRALGSIHEGNSGIDHTWIADERRRMHFQQDARPTAAHPGPMDRIARNSEQIALFRHKTGVPDENEELAFKYVIELLGVVLMRF